MNKQSTVPPSPNRCEPIRVFKKLAEPKVTKLTPALLQLDLMFDPLRGDLRFQKLVRKIVAPKTQ